MENKTAISFSNVTATYDKGQEVLSNVSFNISEKAFCFLSGASGAGKTTLLKLIYKLHKQSDGHIKIFGKSTDNLTREGIHSLRSRMAIVFQEYSLLSHLSVFDNVALPLRVRGVSETIIKKRVTMALNWSGLGDYAKSLPLSLSGGQQQRVSVARAIITEPKILLADEPTGNLDDETAARLMKLFIQMNKVSGTTIILSTHSQKLMDTYNFPVLRVENHKVNFITPASKILKRPVAKPTVQETMNEIKEENAKNYLKELSKSFADIAGEI